MNICEEYAALLDMYADGFCTEEESERVRRHLAECPACRAYVEQVLQMREAFPDPEDTEVPDGFAEGVMAAIRAEAAPRKKRTVRWRSALLPVAACLTIVVALRYVPSLAGGGSAAQEASFAADSLYSSTTTTRGGEENRAESASGGVEAYTEHDASADAKTRADAELPLAEAKSEPAEAFVRMAEVKLTRQQIETLLDGYAGTEENGAIVYKLTAAEFDAVLAQLPQEAFVPDSDLSSDGEAPCLLTVYPTE